MWVREWVALVANPIALNSKPMLLQMIIELVRNANGQDLYEGSVVMEILCCEGKDVLIPVYRAGELVPSRDVVWTVSTKPWHWTVVGLVHNNHVHGGKVAFNAIKPRFGASLCLHYKHPTKEFEKPRHTIESAWTVIKLMETKNTSRVPYKV